MTAAQIVIAVVSAWLVVEFAFLAFLILRHRREQRARIEWDRWTEDAIRVARPTRGDW